MPDPASKAVFLSYASQDVVAALRLCTALRAAGVEVWFDQDALVGGDAWDGKIRGQINSCALFIPVISAATQERLEGYFRLEWKLAANRSHTMAEEKPFLLPVVIDATRDADGKVPAEFRSVQWTKLPGGETTSAFVDRVQKLLGGPSAQGATGAARFTSAPTLASAPAAAAFPKWIVAALSVAVLALAAYVVLRPTAKESAAPVKPAVAETKPTSVVPPVPGPAAPDPKSIAVLAFANLSADKDNEYFSDGLSENILDKLARVPGLRVMARTSSFFYKGRNVPISQIGQELHVGTIIEGSVQRAGNKLRVVAQLINAADGIHVWSETFDREMTDIFAVQDEIALKIAARLQPGAASPAKEQRPTANLDAYDLYLQGRALQIRSASDRAEAVKFYERAVALDPKFALAWARLADARFRPFQRGYDQSPEVVAGTRTAIDRALASQPDQPDALIVRANLMLEAEHDFIAARRELERAKSLQPPSAELKQVEWALARDSGDWPDALRFMRESLSLDPQNGDFTNNYAGPFIEQRGGYAEADRLFTLAKTILGPPNKSPMSRRIMLRVRWRGPEAALRLLEKVAVEETSNDIRPELLVMLGRLEEARAIFDAITPSEASRESTALGTRFDFRSKMLVGLGREDLARAEMEKVRALALREFERGNRAPIVRSGFVFAEISLGHRDSALKELDDWRRDTHRLPSVYQRHVRFSVQAASLYARLGKADEAVALLHEMDANGFQPSQSLRYDSAFASIRSDPRFQKLMQQQEAWAKAQPDPKDL